MQHGDILKIMAIYKFHIDIEKQDYPGADCKFMISLWHTPQGFESRELIAIGLSDNMAKFRAPGTEARCRVEECRGESQFLELMEISKCPR